MLIVARENPQPLALGDSPCGGVFLVKLLGFSLRILVAVERCNVTGEYFE